MITQQRLQRSSGHTFAISDTGPLISAFQSDSFDLVEQIFPIIFVPEMCETELAKHGWKMAQKTPHEPDANVMNAEEALDDAQKLSHLLRRNLAKTHTDSLPFSVLLDSVEKLNRSELQTLKARVEQRLAI